MIELVLTGAGHSVTTAANGRQGLDIYGNGANFDLVITDFKMPDITGLDVEREILQRNPIAKIILISGFGGIDTALEAMNRGATDFLRKPFDPSCLRKAVEAALNGSLKLSPVATVCKEFSRQNINGYSFELNEETIDDQFGNLICTFEIQKGQDAPRYVKVILPAYTQELIKAYIDSDEVPCGQRFFQALCEETMANYLQEHSSIPPSAQILIDDLGHNEQKWIDSMMTVALSS